MPAATRPRFVQVTPPFVDSYQLPVPPWLAAIRWFSLVGDIDTSLMSSETICVQVAPSSLVRHTPPRDPYPLFDTAKLPDGAHAMLHGLPLKPTDVLAV